MIILIINNTNTRKDEIKLNKIIVTEEYHNDNTILK